MCTDCSRSAVLVTTSRALVHGNADINCPFKAGIKALIGSVYGIE